MSEVSNEQIAEWLYRRVQIQASQAVSKALQRGELDRPLICECCDQLSRSMPAHHESYAKGEWLNVIWLCPQCHRDRHTTIKNTILSFLNDTLGIIYRSNETSPAWFIMNTWMLINSDIGLFGDSIDWTKGKVKVNDKVLTIKEMKLFAQLAVNKITKYSE